ncbi:MAG TPA: hypothetical protein VGM01_01205 [Ktedonobacteraceae bacterium]
MSNNAHDKAAQEEYFADIFARLREQDIEQFYAHYQLWVLRKRLPLIEKQLEALREHLTENQQVTESLRPSALALAVLVRLQSNGVNDTDVLDLMLDRGEDWLDRMMQRLDYCEQVEDFIQGDYNQWCIKALEGAYDWIDSLLGSIKEGNGRPEGAEHDGATTEELLLQKLSQDDEETMLEVTLKRPVASLEANTDSNETISTELPPASELEPTAALDEQSKPELTLQSDEAVEQQENSELEQQLELIGWKDLEDLEAPGELPVPWYSIDVTEDGATSVPDGNKQAAPMNDWITILHADASTSKEASTTEAATNNAAELRLAIDSAEATETHMPAPASASEATEQTEEIADLSVKQAEVVEIQDESEAISPINTDQEQSIPARTEPQNAEIRSDESEILVDETPTPEISLATEASLPAEIPASAANNSESTVLTDGSRLDQAEATESSRDENETSAEKAREEAEQSVPESANHFEELTQAVGAQETDPLKQPEEAQTLAQIVPTTDETDSPEAYQTSSADLLQADAEIAEIQPAATDLSPTEAKGTEIQPAVANLSQVEAEGAEAQPAIANLPASENVPAERTEARISITEIARTGDEQTEDLRSQTEDLRPNANGPEEQPGIHADDHTRQTEKEIQGNEIEIAATSNGILSGEEEQAEQLAWYEYLDLEELPANNVVNSKAEERIEPEKAGDTSPDKPAANGTTSPEIYEYAVVEESKNTQNTLLQPENGIAEEVLESEDQQSWSASANDEETLPLVLKEIQQAQHPPANGVQSGVVNEEIEPRDELENTTAEIHNPDLSIEDSRAIAQTGQSASETSVTTREIHIEAGSEEEQTTYPEVKLSTQTKDVSTKSEEHPLSKAANIAEQPTFMIDKIPQIDKENATSRMSKASTSTGQIVHRENTPMPTQFTQPERVEPAPKKLGFWQRLFGFGRKKKH